MVAACDVFWAARMEQMCCQLDKDVALPPCVLEIAHVFIKTNGCDDDEIPSSVGRENLTIETPTQRGTQWSDESLSGDEDDDSKANVLLRNLASAKKDEEIRLPYADDLCTDGPVYKSPEFHRSLRACITKLDEGGKEFDQAMEEYKNASWRTPSATKSPKKRSEPSESPSDLRSRKTLDVAFSQYAEAENATKFASEHVETAVLAQYTYSEEEEEQEKKSAAKKKPKRKTDEEDGIEDPDEKDPRFRIVKRWRRDDPQLTLTQYWPDEKNSAKVTDIEG
jgi:hypothetical protein